MEKVKFESVIHNLCDCIALTAIGIPKCSFLFCFQIKPGAFHQYPAPIKTLHDGSSSNVKLLLIVLVCNSDSHV